jgi:hypothetical protein
MGSVPSLHQQKLTDNKKLTFLEDFKHQNISSTDCIQIGLIRNNE